MTAAAVVCDPIISLALAKLKKNSSVCKAYQSRIEVFCPPEDETAAAMQDPWALLLAGALCSARRGPAAVCQPKSVPLSLGPALRYIQTFLA